MVPHVKVNGCQVVHDGFFQVLKLLVQLHGVAELVVQNRHVLVHAPQIQVVNVNFRLRLP